MSSVAFNSDSNFLLNFLSSDTMKEPTSEAAFTGSVSLGLPVVLQSPFACSIMFVKFLMNYLYILLFTASIILAPN